MKLARTVLAAFVIALTAACSSNPVAPADAGVAGAESAVAPANGPSYNSGAGGSGY